MTAPTVDPWAAVFIEWAQLHELIYTRTPPAGDHGRRSGDEHPASVPPGQPAGLRLPRVAAGKAPESHTPSGCDSGATTTFLRSGGMGVAVGSVPAATPATCHLLRTGEVPQPGLAVPADAGVSEAPAGVGAPAGAGNKS